MRNFKLGRRRFLQSVGIGSASVMLGNWALPAKAEAKDDRLFLFVYFEGGWDTIMSLDPRDPVKDDPQQTKVQLAWDKLGSRWATMGWNGPGSGNGLVEVPDPVPSG